jgi:hypothetical protein
MVVSRAKLNTIAEPIENRSPTISFEAVKELPDSIECWSVSRRSLVSDHYGLTASRFLPTEYRRLTSHRYYRALYDGRSVGILRVIPDIAMTPYLSTLVPEVVSRVEQGTKFSDLGFYYTEKLTSLVKKIVINAAIEFSKAQSSAEGISGLYIQVPKAHVILL